VNPTHLLLLSGLLLTSGFADARSEDPRPNIILIVADDLGYGNLGSYGQALIQTPELDTLAAEGLRFTRFYSGAALCLPSRGTLMTGLHMGHARIRENGGGGVHEPLLEEDTALSTVMKAAGYRTGMIGKWALGDAFQGNTIPELNDDGPGALYKHGWDFYLGEPNQTFNHDYYPDRIYRYDPEGRLGSATPLDELVPYPLADDTETPQFDESYTTDVYLKEALAFVEEAREEPFFLYLPLQTPHKAFVVPELEPYTTTQPWSTDEKRFASMISRMDRMIGDLVDHLQTLGIAGNTLLLFTSDNGGLADFDSLFDNNGPLPGYKSTASEGGLRVPCIAWWPGTIQAGRTSSRLLYFPDFMPTFAALGGIESPSPIDGLSFLPTLLDTGTQPPRDYLFFLAGTDGVNPADQDFHIVKGPNETRSDVEIHQAAFQESVTVPVFTGRRTAFNPSVLYEAGDPLPQPVSRFSILTDNRLQFELLIPDGVSVALEESASLASFSPEGTYFDFSGFRETSSGRGQEALYDHRSVDWSQRFIRLHLQPFSHPELVSENPVSALLLSTDFTDHEPSGLPLNDTAPAWTTHDAIADPGTLLVEHTSGSIPPVFFPGFPDELAIDLNVTNESPWRLDIPLSTDRFLSLHEVSFIARHYSNTGERKALLENSFYEVSVLDPANSELEAHAVAADASGTLYSVTFTQLQGLPPGHYTIRLEALPNGDSRGNNQGLDDLSVYGFITEE